jgi:uncharacterized membrane protein YgcG
MGAIPRYSIHVTDSTEAVLTAADFRSLESRAIQFGNRFPQSRFTVFFTALMPGRSVREYAFWLFNSCSFTAFDSKLSNNFALLLVVDMQSRSACLMIGYGLEPYLGEADLAALAGTVEGPFARGRYGGRSAGLHQRHHRTAQGTRRQTPRSTTGKARPPRAESPAAF